MSQPTNPRPWSFIALGLSGVILGGLLGAITNAINAWVSPTYFREVMGWGEVQDIGRTAAAEGILEGLMFGLVFSVIFLCVVGVVTRAGCLYSLGIRYLAGIAAFALVFWVLGGLVGMGLAWLSPEFYRHAFRGAPAEAHEMYRYAWVGGSIWGIVFGGLAAVVVGGILFRASWLSGEPPQEAGG